AYDPHFDSVWYIVGTTKIMLENGIGKDIDDDIWKNLAQGKFYVFIYANDTLGNVNDTFILTLFKDTLAPKITINSPEEGSYWDVEPFIDVTVYDPNFIGFIWIRIGLSSQIFAANSSGPLDSGIWSGLDQGAFQMKIECSDSFGNISEIIRTLYKDTLAPSILINSPEDLTSWNKPPAINITIFDQQYNASWYRVYSALTGWSKNITLTNNTEQLLDILIWNSLQNVLFQIYFYSNDSLGQFCVPYIRTLYKDTIAPEITITSPKIETSWNNPPLISISASDPHFDSIWYRVYSVFTGWSKNVTSKLLNFIQLLDEEIWNALPDECIFQLYIFANDTAGNINNTFILTLYKDMNGPEIEINSPNQLNVFGNNTINFNITVTDSNLINKTWYRIWIGSYWSENFTITGTTSQRTGVIDPTSWENCPNGTIIIEFYANDSLGNIGFKQVKVYKDMVPPNINIISPIENEKISDFAPDFVLDIDEGNLHLIYYMLINATNQSHLILSAPFIYQSISEILQEDWDYFDKDGDIIIRFFANDTAGNLGSAQVTIEKDTTAPDISIIYPNFPDNRFFGANAPDFIISTSTIEYDTTWYYLENFDGTYRTNIYVFEEFSGTIDQAAWNQFGNEMIEIYFWINDSSNNKNYDSEIIVKDTIAPILKVNSPNNLTVWNILPPISITVFDKNLESFYYMVGSTRIDLLNNTQLLLDSNIWITLSEEGMFQIFIYAKDKTGNTSDTCILTLYKDILAPRITINSPVPNQHIDIVAPTFDIYIEDDNYNTSWYSIYSPITGWSDNITLTSMSGYIDQDLWYDVYYSISTDNYLTIRFSANDSFGHTHSEEVKVLKPGGSFIGDDGDDDDDDVEESDTSELSFSPIFLIIAAAATVGIIIPVSLLIRRSRFYRSSDQKDKKKINKILLLIIFLVLLIFLYILFL
ncbi:MAG: hypothetical protein ACFFAH_08610, partial [Promethearchaeota archaeon]